MYRFNPTKPIWHGRDLNLNTTHVSVQSETVAVSLAVDVNLNTTHVSVQLPLQRVL